MNQAALDRLEDLQEQYAALMNQEVAARLEGWERRMASNAAAVKDIHALLSRDSGAGRRERSRF